MHPRAEEFKQRVEEQYDFDVNVHEFPEGTKTAVDAAEAVGCSVEQASIRRTSRWLTLTK